MSSFSYFVGQRIKKYRKSRGYTIEQFSAMINKSKATLSKYENGAITIDIETLYEIAQALDIDLKCFIDYQPPMFHAEPRYLRIATSIRHWPICTTMMAVFARWYAHFFGFLSQWTTRVSRSRCIWAWRPSPTRTVASICSPER